MLMHVARQRAAAPPPPIELSSACWPRLASAALRLRECARAAQKRVPSGGCGNLRLCDCCISFRRSIRMVSIVFSRDQCPSV